MPYTRGLLLANLPPLAARPAHSSLRRQRPPRGVPAFGPKGPRGPSDTMREAEPDSGCGCPPLLGCCCAAALLTTSRVNVPLATFGTPQGHKKQSPLVMAARADLRPDVLLGVGVCPVPSHDECASSLQTGASSGSQRKAFLRLPKAFLCLPSLGI